MIFNSDVIHYCNLHYHFTWLRVVVLPYHPPGCPAPVRSGLYWWSGCQLLARWQWCSVLPGVPGLPGSWCPGCGLWTYASWQSHLRKPSILWLTMYFNGLVQERHNSRALAMELCLSCTKPSILSTCLWKWQLIDLTKTTMYLSVYVPKHIWAQNKIHNILQTTF